MCTLVLNQRLFEHLLLDRLSSNQFFRNFKYLSFLQYLLTQRSIEQADVDLFKLLKNRLMTQWRNQMLDNFTLLNIC